MSHEKTPAPTKQNRGLEDTIYSSSRTEIALLHSLFAYPARLVCEIVDGLKVEDFYSQDHREIFALIAANSREVARQAPEDHLDPARVLAQLQDAGKLTDTMSRAMLAVTSTGRPPVSRAEIGELATALRRERTRRAMRIAADGLNAAADRSTTDMAKAIDDTKFLAVLADRAGLNTSRLHAVDSAKGVA